MFCTNWQLVKSKPDTKQKDVTRFCNLRNWVLTWVQVGQKLIKQKTYKNQDIRFIDLSTISPLCKRSLNSMHFKAREATVHNQFPLHHHAELALEVR